MIGMEKISAPNQESQATFSSAGLAKFKTEALTEASMVETALDTDQLNYWRENVKKMAQEQGIDPQSILDQLPPKTGHDKEDFAARLKFWQETAKSLAEPKQEKETLAADFTFDRIQAISFISETDTGLELYSKIMGNNPNQPKPDRFQSQPDGTYSLNKSGPGGQDKWAGVFIPPETTAKWSIDQKKLFTEAVTNSLTALVQPIYKEGGPYKDKDGRSYDLEKIGIFDRIVDINKLGILIRRLDKNGQPQNVAVVYGHASPQSGDIPYLENFGDGNNYKMLGSKISLS